MKKTKTVAMILIALACSVFSACSSDDNDDNVTLNKFVLSQTTMSMTPETSETLTCTFFPDNVEDQNVAWSSSDESVATVTDGVVTAVKPGQTTITAVPAANPSLAQSCAVTVVMNQKTVSGSVEGIWEAYTTINVNGQLKIEEGKSLIIEEGVEVIFASADANGSGIEFTVNGNIYCNGTESAPIRFSIPASERTFANVNSCRNLWGGFMLNNGNADAEALFDHCIIEYAGSPMTETSPSVLAGIYSAGEDFGVQITTSAAYKGNLVVTNSTIGNGYADGIYMQGGKGIITNNIFLCNGATGGEAVNVKAGTTTTIAYNIMYSPNTNGLKLSSSGQDDEAGRYQAKSIAYNNTIINGGWRRDGNKGGCIFVEKNIQANVFNNLMVNCKFRAQTPSWGTPGVKAGCNTKTIIDYNCYISGSVTSDFAQDTEEGAVKTAYQGYSEPHENYYDAVDTHSVWAKEANDINIQFINFPYDTNALSNVNYDSSWNFNVASMIDGATDNAELARMETADGEIMDYTNNGLMIKGTEYKAAAPQKFFGAYGK